MITNPIGRLQCAVLVSTTPSEWLHVALADMDRLLIDHAHCEKKAAASAMSLVAGYPAHVKLVQRLSALAVEELQHFRAVYSHILSRGLALGRDKGDPYARALLALARPNQGRLTDRLLLFGLIEARSHERLSLLGDNLTDPELRRFYSELARAERRHAAMFAELATEYDTEGRVHQRLAELARQEARIVASLPIEPRIH